MNIILISLESVFAVNVLVVIVSAFISNIKFLKIIMNRDPHLLIKKILSLM